MATLHRIDVEEWLAALRAGALGSSATRTARTLLVMMLSSAVESRILRSNPLAGVKVARRGPTRAKQALTIPQVEALADAAEPYRVLVLVLAYCGLRPNEAFALRRRHRDDFGQLVVEEGAVEVRGRITATDGKTHRARVVPLPRSPASLPRSWSGCWSPGPRDRRRWCLPIRWAARSVCATSAVGSTRLRHMPGCQSGSRRTRCATRAPR